MPTQKFTGKTVDEAADLALGTLNLKREEVEIVVVNPGRSGILGLGGEPAEIQVTTLNEPGESDIEISQDVSAPSRQPNAPEKKGRVADHVQTPISSDLNAQPAEYSGDTAMTGDDRPEAKSGTDVEIENLATETLDYFLGVMDVVANTYVSEDTSDGVIAFEIEGEDAGLLIGRRGDTLQALQFILNTLISKQLGRRAYVTVDVEGYRERRYDSLRDVANRTALRVSESGKSQMLQPMNAAERRIVHMALEAHPEVQTESKGKGVGRRVVVLPK